MRELAFVSENPNVLEMLDYANSLNLTGDDLVAEMTAVLIR